MSRFSPICACALVLLSACVDENGDLVGLHPDLACTTDDADDTPTRPDDTAPPPPDDSGTPADPPTPVPFDEKLYTEINLDWFVWILSQPRIGNPLFDLTGDACASGQSGDVWFLAGSYSQTVVQRTCTIPAGKQILLPILNEYSSCYFYDACTEEGLKAEVDEELDGATEMYATIDGDDMGDPTGYRVNATRFDVTLPDGNLFQAMEIPVSGAIEDLYGGGYWMLFDPLEPGEHTVTFGGVSFDGRAHDITYTLTVEE